MARFVQAQLMLVVGLLLAFSLTSEALFGRRGHKSAPVPNVVNHITSTNVNDQKMNEGMHGYGGHYSAPGSAYHHPSHGSGYYHEEPMYGRTFRAPSYHHEEPASGGAAAAAASASAGGASAAAAASASGAPRHSHRPFNHHHHHQPVYHQGMGPACVAPPCHGGLYNPPMHQAYY